MPGVYNSLFAGPFAPLSCLEGLSALVIPAEVILVLSHPVPLMLQGGLVLVQVPWRACHVLRNVGVDLPAILVQLGGRQTRLTRLIQLQRVQSRCARVCVCVCNA